MKNTPIYKIHGLTISSEIPLDATLIDTTLSGAEHPDIEIFWGKCATAIYKPSASTEIIQQYLLADGKGFSCVKTKQGYLIGFYDYCEFRIDNALRIISVHLLPGIDPRWASLFLSGSVIAMLLLLSEQCVLHASAVERNGESIVFVADSGMGKSALATLCCLHQYQLITDDVLCIDFNTDQARCYPGSIATRLRPKSLALAKCFHTSLCSETVDQRIRVALHHDSCAIHGIKAIMRPKLSQTATQLSLKKLTPSAALASLSNCPRIPGLQDRHLLLAQFKNLAKLVRQVPIYEMVYPYHKTVDSELVVALTTALAAEPRYV